MLDRLRQLTDFFTYDLWKIDTSPLPVYQRYAIKLFRVSYVLIQELSSGMTNLHAMSLVYTSLLSLVPLIAVSFSVLKGFGVHNQVEPLLMNFVAPLGPRSAEIVDRIMIFVENTKVGVLGALGLVLLLYTVVSLIQKIESAFNYVWHTQGRRSLARRFSDYLSVLLIGPVLVFSAIGITASITSHTVVQHLITIEPFGILYIAAGKALPYLIIIGAFTFIYMFVPNTRVNLRSAFVGALVGGILWQTTGMLFASFATGSTRYDAIYSGFAILIMFMIWVYLSWLILLFGAHIAYLHQHPEAVRPDIKTLRLSNRHRDHLGLVIMSLVAERYYHEGEHWTSDALSERLQISGDALYEMIGLLEKSGLLVETNQVPPAYVPAHDPATIPLEKIFTILDRAGEECYVVNEQAWNQEDVDPLLKDIDTALSNAMAGRTLKDLVNNSGSST